MDDSTKEYGEKHFEHHIGELTDDQLVNMMVENQVSIIRGQRKFANNPLWFSAYTPEQKKYYDAAWDECIKRNIHEIVNKKVEELI